MLQLLHLLFFSGILVSLLLSVEVVRAILDIELNVIVLFVKVELLAEEFEVDEVELLVPLAHPPLPDDLLGLRHQVILQALSLVQLLFGHAPDPVGMLFGIVNGIFLSKRECLFQRQILKEIVQLSALWWPKAWWSFSRLKSRQSSHPGSAMVIDELVNKRVHIVVNPLLYVL